VEGDRGEGKSHSKRGSLYPEKKTRRNMRVWFDFEGIQIMSDVGVIFVPEVMISNKLLSAV